MDFKQLQYIVMIAQEQNITHAAEKLYITRSALNYCLLNLEQELGVPLFRRLPGRLVPTYAGELYLESARQILNTYHDLSRNMNDLAGLSAGRLSIGVTVGTGQRSLLRLLPQFHQKYPQFTYQAEEGNVKQLERMLLEGRIDLAWYGSEDLDAALDYEYIERKPSLLQLALPAGHPLIASERLDQYGDRPVDLRLFQNEAFILMNENTFIWDAEKKLFEKAGFEPKVKVRCSRMDIAYEFVRSGLGPAFLAPNPVFFNGDLNLSRGILMLNVEPPTTLRSTLFYRRGTQFTEAERYMMQLVKQADGGSALPQISPQS